MTTTRPNPLLRIFPSLTDVAFIMPLVFLFGRLGGANMLLSDGDTGWHVRTGEWILAHGRVPTQDLFSFTRPNGSWFAWEWLWDIAFGWLHMHWGLPAVVFASALILCVTYALAFRLITRYSESRVIAIFVTVVVVGGSAMHWLARPHLFTLLFVVVFLTILEADRRSKTGWLRSLPVLMILWTNLHGGFLAGLLILVAYAAGEFVSGMIALESADRSASLTRAKRYAIVFVACAAATFVNPYFHKLHVHIAKYLTDPYQYEHVIEFFSPSFHGGLANFFEPMMVISVAAAVWLTLRREFAPAFLMLGWLHLGLISARNIPIFMLVTAPFAARFIEYVLDALERAPVAHWVRRSAAAVRNLGSDFSALDSAPRLHLVSAGVAALMLVALINPAATGVFRSEFNPKSYPERALATLTDANKRIYSHDEWGDYLIYKLYPHKRVFVDGRSDFYGSEFNRQFIRLLGAGHDWQHILNKHLIDTVLLPVDSALATAMKESSCWRVRYDDGIAIIFERRGPTSASSLEQNSIARNGETRSRQDAGANPSTVTVARFQH
jgi:hypothetical protein